MKKSVFHWFATALLCATAMSSAWAQTSCPLPPPQNLNINNSTSTTISLSWDPVPNPTPPIYKVSFYDITDQLLLPEDYTTQTSFTKTGLLPEHEYSICVSTTACPGGETGTTTCRDGRTLGFVIDDIVQIDCEYNENGFMPILNVPQPFNLTPAANQSQEVHVRRLRVTSNVISSHVEFAIWADCHDVPKVHFRQISAANVVRIPNTDGPTPNIVFGNGYGQGFFNINTPQGMPNSNDLNVTVTFKQFCTVQACEGFKGVCFNCCAAAPREAEAGGETITIPLGLSLAVSPNPAAESFRAEYLLPSESAVTLSLYNATGQVIRINQTPGALPAGWHVAEFQTSDLAAGVYFLCLQTATDRRVVAVRKQ